MQGAANGLDLCQRQVRILCIRFYSLVSLRNAKLYGDVTITWCFNDLACPDVIISLNQNRQKLKPPLVLFAACAPCCLCSGSQRSSRSLSCTWLAACANSTSRNGPTSSLHAAGGSSLSRTFQWSYLKVLSIKTFHLKPLPLYFFLSSPKKHVFAFQTFATRSWTCTLRETNPSLSRCRRRRGHLLLRPLLLQLHRDNRQPLTLLPHHQKRLPLRVVARHASSNAHM